MARTLPVGHRSLILTADASVEATGELLAEINYRHHLLEAIELRVAKDLTDTHFGGVGAVTQVLITWARNDRERILHSYFDDSVADEDVFRDLQKSDHLLAAVLLAKRILSSGRVDITNAVRGIADAVLAEQDDSPVGRRRVFIACLDDDEWHGVSRWLHDGIPERTWLRDPERRPAVWPYGVGVPPRVKVASELARDLMRFAQRLGMYKGLEQPDPKAFYQLAIAASEMFDNTQRWARRAPLLNHPLGQTFRPSLRGFRMKWVDDSAAAARNRGAGDVTLQSFLTRATEAKGWQSFLEISVFDSGAGVFARRLNSNGVDWRTANVEQQFAALSACLVSEYTDDPSGAGEERGNGFTKALEQLTNLGGFFRIRSGRLSMSRDLGADPFTDDDLLNPWLRDSVTGDALTASDMQPAAGTDILMVFPISRS